MNLISTKDIAIRKYVFVYVNYIQMYYEKVKNVKNKIQKQPPRGVPGKRCSVLFFF